MKKGMHKFLTITADVALKTAAAASGLASAGGLHQMKEPENLKVVVKRHSKNAK